MASITEERLQALLDQRNAAWKVMRDALTDAEQSGEGLRGELLGTYTAAEADYEARDAEYQAASKARQLEIANARTIEQDPMFRKDDGGEGRSYEEYNDVFKRYLRGGMLGLDLEERQLLASRMGANVDAEGRVLTTSTGDTPKAGYTVPEGFWAKITEARLAFGQVEPVANVITTATGNDLPWATNDDTGNVGELLTDQDTAVSEQDTVFGQKVLNAYTYSSKLVKVSLILLQDSAFDVEAYLSRKLGERLGRIHASHLTTGTGTGQPDGIATSPTTGVTSASATLPSLTDWTDLIHSVDAAYRGPRSRFMFNDTTMKEIRQLVDADGRPLWQPSLSAGVPDNWLGYPYTINPQMPNTATGNVAALFGDFYEGYVVRNVRAIQLVRFDEKYMDKLQVGFFAFDRQDGTKDNTAAYKALVMA